MKKETSILEKILFGSPKIVKQKQLDLLINKTILITGASYGIGEALTLKLLHINCRLILVARTIEKLLEFNPTSAQITPIKCDLTKPEELDILINRIGKVNIDFFINNAGRSMKKNISSSAANDTSKVMNLHFNAPTYLITSLLKNLNHSTIINTSSAGTLFPPTEKWSAYNASKIAFLYWLETLKIETQTIKIKQLYLPLVHTRMIPSSSTYQNFPKMSRHHAATLILELMTTNKKSYKPWWLASSAFLVRTFTFIWKPIVKIAN